VPVPIDSSEPSDRSDKSNVALPCPGQPLTLEDYHILHGLLESDVGSSPESEGKTLARRGPPAWGLSLPF